SIAEEVEKRCKEKGVTVRGVEGKDASEWVLLDLGDVLLHVMQAATRKLYDLESLWKLSPTE
ncbi:MAG: ribosome silencing factor, partial [Pseudohongiellaceae bacterium]